MRTTLKTFINIYREKNNANDSNGKAIEDRISQREKQIERLKKKLGRIGYIYWIKEIIEPVAKRLMKYYPGYYYEILGPFGMCSETAIHIMKNGWEEMKDFKKWKRPNIFSITFLPLNLSGKRGKNPCLGIRDESKDTGEYARGTIGEMNGMNHPTIKLKDTTTIKELLKYVK